MSTRLAILGILRVRPLHGYEIKHIIEEAMGDWTSIAFGSIYFALGKMAEEGIVEKIAVEQEGGRPTRSIYQVTDKGEDEFLRLLRQEFKEIERHYHSIDIAVAFMDALPKDEVIGYLRRRVAELEFTLHHIRSHEEEQMNMPDVPASAAAVFDHSLLHFEAELTWSKRLLQQVEEGRFDK